MTSQHEQTNEFLDSDALSDKFFIEIVENKLNIKSDEFKLRLVLLSPATGNNENFLAVLYRAKIKIEIHATKERKHVDVIIKALLSTLPEMKEMGVFPRERFMYSNVLTSFEEIWLDRTGEVIKFGPRMIKMETDPYEQIIMDDLKAEGFEMMDRKIGLSLEQTKMVLTKLAKFHASSAIRYQKDGMLQQFLDRHASLPGGDPEANPFYQGLVILFKGLLECMRSYGGYDAYADKFERWDFKKLSSQWFDIAVPMKSGFTVLNHGDMWLNNLMFKSDEAGNPLEVSLIDYQTPCWGTPSSDLIYFLISSVQNGVKVDNFDEIIKHYHDELTESLKKLNFDGHVPSLIELQGDLLDNGGFACFCLMLVLFVCKYDSTEELNIGQIMTGGDPEMIQRIYNNETYKKAIQNWLPFLNERGFLDVLVVNAP